MNAVRFIIFGLLMARRYVNAISEVEQNNANLAQRLKEREEELELSHQRLREVELQQTISAIRSVERGAQAISTCRRSSRVVSTTSS